MHIREIPAASLGMYGLARVMEFDGLAEMVREAAGAVTKHAHLATFDLYDHQWIGRKFAGWDDVIKAVDGTWTEGVDKIEELAARIGRENLPRPTVIRRRREWNDIGGAEVCLDRYRAGDPFRRDAVKVRTHGPRVITLLTQVGENCDMSSEALFWRGALAVVLARMIEDAGYRAEIKAFSQVERTWADGTGLLNPVVLKEAGDPLDIGSLANATSGWFFRTVSFASFLIPGKPLSWGLGRAINMTPEAAAFMCGDAHRWELNGVFNMDTAVKLARKLLQQLVLEAA